MLETITLEEIERRFGKTTPRRQFLFKRLQILVHWLLFTGKVRHIYLFGSFVGGKPSPNDIDLLVVMDAGFTTTHLSGKALEPFQYEVCKLRYQADVFWVTEAIGNERIADLLDVFSINRERRQQTIIEVKV